MPESHTSPIGRGVIVAFVGLILIGIFGAAVSVVGVATQNTNKASSNRAASANQHNSHCTSVQGIRWRQASTAFQAGTADLVAAGRDPEKLASAKEAIARARAELAAVAVDDARIDDPDDPLCPYVAGDPDRTPNKPVNPTPPSYP